MVFSDAIAGRFYVPERDIEIGFGMHCSGISNTLQWNSKFTTVY